MPASNYEEDLGVWRVSVSFFFFFNVHRHLIYKIAHRPVHTQTHICTFKGNQTHTEVLSQLQILLLFLPYSMLISSSKIKYGLKNFKSHCVPLIQLYMEQKHEMGLDKPEK